MSQMSEERVIEAVLRQDLSSFIAKSFHTTVQGQVFEPSWYLDAIADYLGACERGEITRLIINMPPRYLKSHCVTVAWPAWLIGHRPERKVIAASYSRELAIRHALDCRLITAQRWYRRLFPQMQLRKGQIEKHRMVTTRQGMRLATSVGGTLTGDGGDVLILDDPLNPRQAYSDTIRGQVNQWVQQTFLSRLNDKRSGVVILVMQRLHPDDVTGYLLEQMEGNWEQLCLPAIAERKTSITIGQHCYERDTGEVLHPVREGPEVLDRLKVELGSHAFAAQYQQKPVSTGGDLIQLEWFQRYKTVPEEGVRVHSWDTAFQTGESSDYSVCTVWSVTEAGHCYLLHILRKRMAYPELRREVLRMVQSEQPDAVLIEAKASGQSLIQDLREEQVMGIIPVQPKGDKKQRVASVSAMIEAGQVNLPQAGSHSPWLADFEQECARFPLVTHDDQVDSMVQCLNWVKHRYKARAGMRRL